MSSNYYIEPRPARKIPTREQIAYQYTRTGNQSKQHFIPQQQASQHRVGHSAGLHPEDTPYTTGDYELEEDAEYYVTRPHSSTIRYQVSPEHVYQQGNQRLHIRYVDVPKRKSRQPQLPQERERYTDEVEAVPTAIQHKRSRHPLLYLGVGMIAMLALFLLLSSAATWIQTTKDDLTYGRPRTFNIDAVVGHFDSAANPTHFIAINLNRHVQVIEIPGQDSTKERVFQITTLFGDGQDLTPITLSFHDLLGNGKLDMLIHIQNTTIAMINENGTFRPAKPGEIKGLV